MSQILSSSDGHIDDPAGCLIAAIQHLEDRSILHGEVGPRIAAGLRVLATHLAPYQEPGFFRFMQFYNSPLRPSIEQAVAACNDSLPEGFPAITAVQAMRGLEALRTIGARRLL